MNTSSQQITKIEFSIDDPLWLKTFLVTYTNLNTANLQTLEDVYHQQVVFEDPLHKIEGLSELKQYFSSLYQNLNSCYFTITHSFKAQNEAAVYWTMSFCHPKLNKGQTINVCGHSHLKGVDNKVIYHRDYLDAGAMLYEHIPLLGYGVRWIKQRVSQ